MSIRSAFDQELEDLRDDVLRLGSMVDTAMSLSMKALKERDQPLARQIIADDEKINRLRFKIEEDPGPSRSPAAGCARPALYRGCHAHRA